MAKLTVQCELPSSSSQKMLKAEQCCQKCAWGSRKEEFLELEQVKCGGERGDP